MTMTPEQLQAYRWEREIDERNRPLTDDELDTMFPPGYKILNPPAGAYSLTMTVTKLNQVQICKINDFIFVNQVTYLLELQQGS